MLYRLISGVLLLAFLNYLVGCTKTERVLKEELSGVQEKILDVVLTTGDVVDFGEDGGTFDRSAQVIRGTKNVTEALTISIDSVVSYGGAQPEKGERVPLVVLKTQRLIQFDGPGGLYDPVKRVINGIVTRKHVAEVRADDILYARVQRYDPVASLFATVGVIAGIAGVVVIIALATKESCPFVYSFDGEKYVFDAEPLGGVITKGLQKTDLSRLEHLKAVDGKYRLLMRNEVRETQHIDQVSLLVLDHPVGCEVIPDFQGNLHCVGNVVGATAAVDEDGKDLSKFVRARDGIAWQTKLPIDSSFRGRNLRHQLTFEFPKPTDAKTAKLVVNTGTSLWGSHMIRAMLDLRGDRVDAWYDAVNNGGPEFSELANFIERDELYVLKLYTRENGSWVQHGVIPGGGPLLTKDRVIPLDVSNIAGDKLTIRLNPPWGFWAIDYIGVEYGILPPPDKKEIPLLSAQDQGGNDVLGLLRSTDQSYEVLPKVGDWVKMDFDVPRQKEGTERSIFLKTSGYYEIHLSKDHPEETLLIQRCLSTPGLIVQYAMEEYLKWRSGQLSLN